MAKPKLQPDIIILGLGPGDPAYLTLRASAVINQSREIYLRTRDHPTVAGLPEGLEIHSFDSFYEEEEIFENVYQRIAKEIITLAKKMPGVVYAVPGDPFIAEDTPALILTLAKAEDLVVEVVPGVSFLEPTFAALERDPLPQVTILDALEMQKAYYPPFPPDKPVLIVQIYSQEIASNVKLTLMAVYPDDHQVSLIHDAGTPAQTLEKLPLFELDRSKLIKNRTAIYVPPLADGTSLESFLEIIAHLRSPEGCSWDREQDHQTLRPNLLEETFEALEAIDGDDPAAMEEEFGDLLLQIVLHAQIASEYGEFTMGDVIRGIYTKLIKRHPHVFGDLDLDEPDVVLENWEKIKAKERELNGQPEKGMLDGVPASLPALTQAETYQKRAARVGFDWEDINGVLEKIPEEIKELQAEDDLKRQSAEIGDILFSIVNIARWMKVDAESALRGANQRFKDRFAYLEKEARAGGRKLNDMNLEELDELWERSKDTSGD
ncbi:MAG: nucleoside triphosphate pyrophosphohydrolase [Chloroflexi bacterium]|nr:nucleoside triphosphate pyrophosphohydrolase [Chloroflexota bacterium]